MVARACQRVSPRLPEDQGHDDDGLHLAPDQVVSFALLRRSKLVTAVAVIGVFMARRPLRALLPVRLAVDGVGQQQTTHATERVVLMSLAERLCWPEATARERDECARALLASAAATATAQPGTCVWTVAHVAVLLTPLRQLLANSGDRGAKEGARALHTHVASVRMSLTPLHHGPICSNSNAPQQSPLV